MHVIRPTILLIVGIFLSYHFAREFKVSITESAPTRIDAHDWKTNYHGQRWLSVHGHLAPGFAAVMSAKSTDTAYVPIVPEDYTPGESVHFVLVASGLPPELGDAIIRSRAQTESTFTGTIPSLGAYNSARIFPNLHVDPDVIYIDDKAKPDPPIFCMIPIFIGVALIIVSARTIGTRGRRRCARVFFRRT